MRSSRRASQGPLYYNNYRMPAKVVRVVMVMIIMMVMVMVMEAALLQHLRMPAKMVVVMRVIVMMMTTMDDKNG